MFSAAKAKNIERAFREYASDKVAALNETQFSRAGQKVFRERAEQLAVENKGHRLERKNEKVIERG